MAEIQGVSSATSPYEKATYSAKSNDKNTLSIESYFKLLSAQLANQDMTSPMDNSEMMAQMTQMAMVQSLGTMTTNMKQEMALTKTSYLAGLTFPQRFRRRSKKQTPMRLRKNPA